MFRDIQSGYRPRFCCRCQGIRDECLHNRWYTNDYFSTALDSDSHWEIVSGKQKQWHSFDVCVLNKWCFGTILIILVLCMYQREINRYYYAILECTKMFTIHFLGFLGPTELIRQISNQNYLSCTRHVSNGSSATLDWTLSANLYF